MNAKEQMEALGHDPADIDGELDSEKQDGLDQPAPQQSQTDLDQEETEEETVEASEETEEEVSPNDRTWQSQYDKERTEREKLAQEKAELEAKNEAMLAMLQTVGQTTQPTAQPEKKKPELWDFIQQDEYFSEEALNPATASGQAYLAWQDAVQDWKTEQNLAQFEQRQQAKQQETVARSQATRLSERFSEFRNPLTNEPNMPKIAKFMDDLSRSDDPDLWADLYEFTKNRNKTQPKPDLSEIGRKANKVSAVASQSASEKEKKSLPKSLNNYRKTFGDDFEFPVGAEFE